MPTSNDEVGSLRQDERRVDTADTRRNLWGSARERNRRRARITIRKRIEHGQDIGIGPREHKMQHVTRDWVELVVWNIIKGKKSYFSLTCIVENHARFEVPHSSRFLLDRDENELVGTVQMRNLLGEQEYAGLREMVKNDVESFTIYEFAVWCRRWHIVAGLLTGGVNPCVRGRRKQRVNEGQIKVHSAELFECGSIILQAFFKGVPLSMSASVVRNAVEQRRSAVTGRCPKCSVQDWLLSCSVLCEGVCEKCWWRNIIKRIGDDEDRIDVCSVCCKDHDGNGVRSDPTEQRTTIRCKQSSEEARKKFMALPRNIQELKQVSFLPTERESRKQLEDDFLSSAWSLAVVSGLGKTQDLRKDRFFGYIVDGSYHHVKGLLVHGIDLDLQNEYGQTGIFVASWKGNTKVVQLLLEHGANPNIRAHGGLNSSGVASVCGHEHILRMLSEYGAESQEVELESGELGEIGSTCKLTTLIDSSFDHPGAGSYLIDDAVASKTINSIRTLWETIPFELNTIKMKAQPCSQRSYYCDVKGFIRRVLCRAITEVLGPIGNDNEDDIVVLEYMRFLYYSEQGTVLGPHVDLSRIDQSSGKHSTHTFILYLTDCSKGGETVLLDHTHGEGRHMVRANVSPRCGRLLLFPHDTPHEGKLVIDVPKLLVRGEVIIPF